MEFTTNFKHHPRHQETFNNKEQKIYRASVNKKTGERELVVDKVINIYDKIQEYKDETQISNILKRYDLDMLEQLRDKEEQFIDLTNMPENLMETMAIIDSAKFAWERQSKELKAKFDNDFNKFIASSENGQLADLLNKELQTSRDRFTSEVQAQMAPVSVVEPVKTTTQQTTQVVQPTQQTTTIVGGNSNV